MILTEYLYNQGNIALTGKERVLDFINMMLDWQDTSKRDFIDELMNLPKEIVDKYTTYGTMYRGLKVHPQELRDQEVASWSIRKDQSYFIATRFTHIREITGSDKDVSEIRIMVFKKIGEGISLNKIIEELISWIKDNEEFVLSQIDVEDVDMIISGFRLEEEEVMSPFCVSDSKVIYNKCIEEDQVFLERWMKKRRDSYQC